MTVVFFFICIILFFVLFIKAKILANRLSLLEEKIELLEEQVISQTPEVAEHAERPEVVDPVQAEAIHPRDQEGKKDETAPPPIPADTPAMEEYALEATDRGIPEPEFQDVRIKIIDKELWQKIERRFVENWTGIIGAVVLVMGVTFLGVYAALALEPFYRFLMTAAIGLALGGLSFFIQSKGKWAYMAVWVRGSAGAILLFACLGSGWIEGLKWVDDPSKALVLLAVGVSVNVFLGFIAGKEVFASFHTIASLIALGIAPQSPETLIIATIVILFGISFSYRSPWEHHLLLTIVASLIYHFYWHSSMGLERGGIIPIQIKVWGIATVASIGVAACLVHYRKIYGSKEFDFFPFLAHLANWTFMVSGFLLYSTGSKWNTFVLSGGAILAFLLARRARRWNIRWLHITDTLIAQSIALYALAILDRWGFDWLSVTAAIYLEVLVFCWAMMNQQDLLLRRAGIYLHLFSVPAVLISAIHYLHPNDARSVAMNSMILAGVLGLQTIFHNYLKRIPVQDLWLRGRVTILNEFSATGIFVGLLALLLFGYLRHYLWSGYMIAGLGSLLFYLRQRGQSIGLGIGLVIFFLFVHGFAWSYMWADLEKSEGTIVLYALPFFGLSLAGMKWSFLPLLGKNVRWLGIYLFSAHLILFTFLISRHVSPWLAGIYWLVLSILYLEGAIYISKKFPPGSDHGGAPERHLLHVGYILLALFVFRHFVVHLQSEMYWGELKIRFLVELFALAIFLFWAVARAPEELGKYKGWSLFHPLFWELVIATCAFIIALEAPSKWHPTAWILMAFGLLFSGRSLPDLLSRFRFYALVFFWAAAFHVAFISGMEVTPSMKWSDRTWFAAILSIILQFIFAVSFYRREDLKDLPFPRAIDFFGNWTGKVQTGKHLAVFYPFFLAVAFFFYGSFDRAVLTLFWVFEAFVIFALSIFLRENHFRYVSMAFLVGCLIRLLLYDLSRTSTLTRAVVFLGVGILMLAMNSLYNRYKERF